MPVQDNPAPATAGYADVDAMLAERLAGVRDTLGPQLVGVYLDGSLATGDFAEHSRDIDVLVVTEGALSNDGTDRPPERPRRERRCDSGSLGLSPSPRGAPPERVRDEAPGRRPYSHGER
jgi:hypothetical protein